MRNNYGMLGIILLAMAFFLSPVLVFAQEINPLEMAAPDGKILYVDTTERGKSYLAVISPDGSDKKRLTPGYSYIIGPRFCATSGWIGFTNKLPDMTSEIYLLSRDGKKIKKVFTGSAFECFSPDGKFLLYTTCDQNASLYSYSIEKKTTVKLSDDLKVTGVDWSPASDWIAISALAEDGTNDLWLISTLGQGIERLTQTPGFNESCPVFTKDGKYLAFTSDRYGDPNEIEFLNIEKRELQRPLIQGMYPTLSPANNWVAYEIGQDIAISRANGLEPKVVTSGRSPFWVPSLPME